MPTSTCRTSKASCSPTAICERWSRNTTCIPGFDDDSAMLMRLKRDISVNIVTTPILDPRTGREREVVDAFTLSYDNRAPEKAQKGATWLVDAFLAEHRRQRQGRASNAAQFYAKEAERIRTHVAGLESKLAEFKRANAGQLPELTEVNMSMMDRAESAARARQRQQMRSAAPGTRVPRRAARAGALRGAGCGQRSPARGSVQRACDRATTRAIRTWLRCAGRSTA